MLSDVLHDARDEIERWEAEEPEWYGHMAVPLQNVKTAMRAVQLYLDASPLVTDTPDESRRTELVKAVLSEVANLDVSKIVLARSALEHFCKTTWPEANQ
jgi:isochorismate synthase EntC